MLDFDAETDIEDEINIDDENTYNMMNFDLDADFDVVDYNEEDSEKNFMTDEDEKDEDEENEDEENEDEENDDENEDENYLKESLPKNNYSFTLTKQELMSKFWDENLEDILQLPEEEFLQLPEELQKLTKLKIQTLEKG